MYWAFHNRNSSQIVNYILVCLFRSSVEEYIFVLYRTQSQGFDRLLLLLLRQVLTHSYLNISHLVVPCEMCTATAMYKIELSVAILKC